MSFDNLSDEDLCEWSSSVIDDTRNLPQPVVGMILRSPYDVIRICEIGPTVSGLAENADKMDTVVAFRVIEVISEADSSLTRDYEPSEQMLWGDLISPTSGGLEHGPAYNIVEAVQQELPFSQQDESLPILSSEENLRAKYGDEISSEKFRKLLHESAKIRESSYQSDHTNPGKYEITIAEAVMIADSRLRAGENWRNLAAILLTADWNSALEW